MLRTSPFRLLQFLMGALLLRTLRKPNVVESPPGLAKPSDLPLELFKAGAKAKHVFDVIGEHDFTQDLPSQVTNICLESRFHHQPVPFLSEGIPRNAD